MVGPPASSRFRSPCGPGLGEGDGLLGEALLGKGSLGETLLGEALLGETLLGKVLLCGGLVGRGLLVTVGTAIHSASGLHVACERLL